MWRILLVPSAGFEKENQMDYQTLSRCQETYKLWQTGEYDLILLTGGICQPEEFQTVPGAQIMKWYFLYKKVPEKNLLTEDHAHDTFENIRFSLQRLQTLGIFPQDAEITVVTKKKQCRRFRISFNRAYHIKIKEHYVEYLQTTKENIYEFISLIIHLLDPKGNGFIAKRNRQNRTFSGPISPD